MQHIFIKVHISYVHKSMNFHEVIRAVEPALGSDVPRLAAILISLAGFKLYLNGIIQYYYRQNNDLPKMSTS